MFHQFLMKRCPADGSEMIHFKPHFCTLLLNFSDITIRKCDKRHQPEAWITSSSSYFLNLYWFLQQAANCYSISEDLTTLEKLFLWNFKKTQHYTLTWLKTNLASEKLYIKCYCFWCCCCFSPYISGTDEGYCSQLQKNTIASCTKYHFS